MSELSDFIRVKNFINIYTKMASSDTEKGIIYVEDPSDVSFWRKVVKMACPKRYDVKAFSKEKTGKRRLEKEYAYLHRDRLVAVDSDFDYLCPQRNEYAVQLNNNPFILHTVFYSKENFIVIPEAIEELEENITFEEEIETKISDALERFSMICFDALEVFSYLHNKDQQQYTESELKKCFKLLPGMKLINDDLEINEETYEHLTNSVQRYMHDHIRYISEAVEFSQHKTSLMQKNINNKTTLFYLNGHAVKDNVLKPLLVDVIRILKKRAISSVEEQYPKSQIRDRKQHVGKFYDVKCAPDTMIQHCKAYQRQGIKPWDALVEQLQRANAAQ